MSSHYKAVCKHGTIVTQCRCPSPSKQTTVVDCPPSCGATPMTQDSFMRKMLDAFPLAVVETDNDGQLAIYTGLHEVDVNGVTMVVPMSEED